MVLSHPWVKFGDPTRLLVTPQNIRRNNSARELSAFAESAMAVNRVVLQHMSLNLLEEHEAYPPDYSLNADEKCNILPLYDANTEDDCTSMFSSSPPTISGKRQTSMPAKLTLEHSDSNSSTESAASSVESNSTVSSEGNGGGSDGTSVDFHLPVRQIFLSKTPQEVSSKKTKFVHQFGLSPPSESKLLQRRYREGVERKYRCDATKVNHSSLRRCLLRSQENVEDKKNVCKYLFCEEQRS